MSSRQTIARQFKRLAVRRQTARPDVPERVWERNMAAARQFHAREGHLRVPRQHREDVDGELLGLGSFVANARRRAAKLSPKRREAINVLGMRW
ncbi:helicase associated domain-containing protein [Streptomyces sp. NPDC047461]|uniref:helicase associated domain-containing protein n=1 Tax=Streptomyces sp. NPDC047461 TaxID=3155619 RepID=UPI0033C315CC